MSNVREMMARLNPTNVRFDIGRCGGAPALTAQDIAAALGMVTPGLGREVLIACWWPDGSKLDGASLARHLLAVIGTEWQRQGHELEEARMELSIAQTCAGWHEVVTPVLQRELTRTQSRWDAAKAAA